MTGPYATGRERPWKARAFLIVEDPWHPNGVRAVVKARAAAKSQEGLAGFVAFQEGLGRHVTVWEDPPLPLEDVIP